MPLWQVHFYSNTDLEQWAVLALDASLPTDRVVTLSAPRLKHSHNYEMKPQHS